MPRSRSAARPLVVSAAAPVPRGVGAPILVALVENGNITTGVALGAAGAKPGPHLNGTLCIVRPNRTLWYWDGGPSGAWNRVAL